MLRKSSETEVRKKCKHGYYDVIMDIYQAVSKERLHVKSMYMKFEEVLTNTSIFRAYNVHLLFPKISRVFFDLRLK